MTNQCNDILAQLRRLTPKLVEKYGITRMGIFGSVATGQADENSDVDIVYDMQIPNLFKAVHLRQELEKALSLPVDIVRYRKEMNPLLKKRIESEGIYVL
jgi:uncharacterized protein